MGPLKPCLVCGELTQSSRCPEHRLKNTSARPSATKRGYDYQWQKLSNKARALQPWCSDQSLGGCKGVLSVDHSPEAWAKAQSGQRLTLKDFTNGLLTIRCMTHNIAAGKARGNGVTRTQ